MSTSLLQNNINALASTFGITEKSAKEMVHALSKALETTPEMTTMRISQALYAQGHLGLQSWDYALAILAKPEPTIDKSGWLTNSRAMTMAWHGLDPAIPSCARDESAMANWYSLCKSPEEVTALFFQFNQVQATQHIHLAVWRLAHMWEEKQRSAA